MVKAGAQSPNWLSIGITLLLLAIGAGLVGVAFERLPTEGTSLGIDWKNIYSGIHGLTLTYSTEHDGLRNPPWSVLLLLLLGLLSYRSSWGVMMLIGVGVLIACVPRSAHRRRYWLAVLLAISSYPFLRQVADGGVEALVIAGILLIIWAVPQKSPIGLAIGVLLATAKVQETWLLLLFLAFYLREDWRTWLSSGALVAGVVALSLLWRGREWLNAMIDVPQPGQGTLIDMSLVSVFSLHNIPGPLIGIVWCMLLLATAWVTLKSEGRLSREKAGFLICASLILSPYAAGNSFLTAFAIGVIPFFNTMFGLTLVLILLIDVQYLIHPSLLFQYGNLYSLILVFVLWMLIGWKLLYGPPLHSEFAKTVSGRQANPEPMKPV